MKFSLFFLLAVAAIAVGDFAMSSMKQQQLASDKSRILIVGPIEKDLLTYVVPASKELFIDIDSEGGILEVANQVIAKINYHKMQGVTVKCRVLRRAWSSALFILAACSKRTFLPGSTLLLHEVKAMFPPGTLLGVKDLQQVASELQESNQQAKEFMAKSFGIDSRSPSLNQVFTEGKALDPDLFTRAVGASSSWIVRE